MCCPHPIEKQQQRVKQAAVLEVSSCGSGGSGRPCEVGLSSFSVFSLLYQQYHHMLWKNRRFWYQCPAVPEGHRRVLIQPVKASHCLLSRWLTVAVIWTEHTHSHTHFLL